MSTSDACWAAWLTKLDGVEWLAPNSDNRDEDGLLASSRSLSSVSVAHEVVLMEIVGALGLDSKTMSVDPNCQVEVFDPEHQKMMVVHRTDTLWDDGNPIWTTKTKSLCLLSVPLFNTNESSEVYEFVDAVQDEDQALATADLGTRCSVVIGLFDGLLPMGTVTVPFSSILESARTEARIEMPINPRRGFNVKPSANLALRFRLATYHDIDFLEKLSAGHRSVRSLTKKPTPTFLARGGLDLSCDTAMDVPIVDQRRVAADINFRSVKARYYFRRRKKIDENGQIVHLVKPYPNPIKPSREWMTREQIETASEAPSNQWVSAGCGQAGMLYIEVLKCDGLPPMDIDSSDPFVLIAFEDSCLRTDVVWEQLNPRWPNWCTRAFKFAIHHPSSLVYISVCDFDESPLDTHDPIGRVVLELGSFRPGLTYTLHYPLRFDPNEKPPTLEEQSFHDSRLVGLVRGAITLRIRLEWQDEAKAMKLFLSSPPRFIVNVDNKKSFDVLGYTIRGAAYMERASMASISILANEITSYSRSLYFALDVWLEIFLWRGRLRITKTWHVWFPIRSILFFFWSMALVERPDLFIPIQLLGISWVLLSINYHASRRSSPWQRVPSSLEIGSRMWLGRYLNIPFLEEPWSFEIEPNQGLNDAIRYDKLDKLKAGRISALITELMSLVWKVCAIYGGEYVELTTERSNWSFLSGQLSTVHMILTLIVTYLRIARSFLSWQSVYTAVFTAHCLLVAAVWLLLPVGFIFHWFLRILAITVHGPWLKLIDVWYFRPWYETRDELLNRIDAGRDEDKFTMPDFDSILGNETFQQAARAARTNTEDLTKLRDMRTLLFGSFSEIIPSIDNARYPSVPLSQSRAVKDTSWSPLDSGGGYHVPGQRLAGRMVHERQHMSD